MRNMRIKQQKEKKRTREARKTKKLLLALIGWIFVLGIMAVDQGYSEMMDHESKILPTFRRMNSEDIVLRVWGKTFELNTKEVQETLAQFLSKTEKSH